VAQVEAAGEAAAVGPVRWCGAACGVDHGPAACRGAWAAGALRTGSAVGQHGEQAGPQRLMFGAESALRRGAAARPPLPPLPVSAWAACGGCRQRRCPLRFGTPGLEPGGVVTFTRVAAQRANGMLPSMRAWGIVGLVGAALLAAGLAWGFTPVSAYSGSVGGAVSCGSAFTASDRAANPLLDGAVCDPARSSRRAPAVALLVGGAVVGLTAVGAPAWRAQDQRT
jgi:hypothetical protein